MFRTFSGKDITSQYFFYKGQAELEQVSDDEYTLNAQGVALTIKKRGKATIEFRENRGVPKYDVVIPLFPEGVLRIDYIENILY